MEKIIINHYSMYQTKDYCAHDFGSRMASIVDKLIEIAARKCDHYASDVYYDIKRLEEACDNEQKIDRILVFRETGVLSYDTSNITKNLYRDTLRDEKNIWRLEHKLVMDMGELTWETMLVRVYLKLTDVAPSDSEEK